MIDRRTLVARAIAQACSAVENNACCTEPRYKELKKGKEEAAVLALAKEFVEEALAEIDGEIAGL